MAWSFGALPGYFWIVPPAEIRLGASGQELVVESSCASGGDGFDSFGDPAVGGKRPICAGLKHSRCRMLSIHSTCGELTVAVVMLVMAEAVLAISRL